MNKVTMLTTAFIVAILLCRHRNSNAFVTTNPHKRDTRPILPLAAKNLSLLQLSKTTRNDEDQQGIFDTNVPKPVKTKRGGRQVPDILYRRPDRKPRFDQPPLRESGYYESRMHRLYDGHVLAFDEYFVADNVRDLVICLNNLSNAKGNEKSSAVFEYCRKKQYNFLCADWLGRGESSGKIMEATISRWVDDTIHFLDNQAKHVVGGQGAKAVMVGCGVGGWVALLVALRRPDLCRGIVGLSADPDFTEDLLWAKLPEEEKVAIMRDGFKEVKWGGRDELYPITSSLIEDGRKNLLLRGGKDSLEIMCPVRLIHSLEDEEVPYSVPLKLAEAIQTDNVRVIMPKVGGHNLSQDYMPAKPGWIDPEDPNPPEASGKQTIKTALNDMLDQVFFSTMPVDGSSSW